MRTRKQQQQQQQQQTTVAGDAIIQHDDDAIIKKPIGYELAQLEDRAMVDKLVFALGECTASGPHHMEMFRIGRTHYNLCALGYIQPVTLDDMLQLSVHKDGRLKEEFTHLYIHPAMPYSALHDWQVRDGVKESVCLPALIVEIPTLTWGKRVNTRSIVSIGGNNSMTTNSNAAAASSSSSGRFSNPFHEIFPFLAEGSTDDSRVQAAVRHYTLNNGVSNKRKKPSGPAAPEQILAEIHIPAGRLSPGNRLLPQLALPRLSGELDDNVKDPQFPIPSQGEENQPHVRAQLTAAFRLLYRLHNYRSERQFGGIVCAPPQELILEPLNKRSPLRFRCYAFGYSGTINLMDLLRLYVVDPPLYVRQLGYDFSAKPQSSNLPPGGLFVEVEIQPPRETAAGDVLHRPAPTPRPQAQPQQLSSPRGPHYKLRPVVMEPIERPAPLQLPWQEEEEQEQEQQQQEQEEEPAREPSPPSLKKMKPLVPAPAAVPAPPQVQAPMPAPAPVETPTPMQTTTTTAAAAAAAAPQTAANEEEDPFGNIHDDGEPITIPIVPAKASPRRPSNANANASTGTGLGKVLSLLSWRPWQ